METGRRHEPRELHLHRLEYMIPIFLCLLTQEEIVRCVAFRYISDAITKEEALEILKSKETGKNEREANVRELGCVDPRQLRSSNA